MDPLGIPFIVVLMLGISTVLWSSAGLVRVLTERGPRDPGPYTPLAPTDVAVLIAAHNEELVIADTVRAARRQVPAENVFVVSDGSSDGTAFVARAEGASVVELQPNRGKAGAITAGLDLFEIGRRFRVVLLLDADTRPRDDYLTTGLPLFDEPDVVAVAGRATTASDATQSRMARFLVAYRERVYVCTQFLQKFGQASAWADAVAIVPGFASMYRTDVLADIDIDAEGLSIEDFNMTFEVHAKQLGRIAFHPSCAIAETQDPAVFGDYVHQVRRWGLGFWQTVRRHRLRAGVFWWALALFVVETVLTSSALVLLVPVLVALGVALAAQALGVGGVEVVDAVAPVVGGIALAFLVIDLILTVVAALLTRTRPTAWALLFPLMRIVDAVLCLSALVLAFRRPSSGRWRSPRRREFAGASKGA